MPDHDRNRVAEIESPSKEFSRKFVPPVMCSLTPAVREAKARQVKREMH